MKTPQGRVCFIKLFDTYREALDAVMEVIEREGIRSFLEGESAEMH